MPKLARGLRHSDIAGLIPPDYRNRLIQAANTKDSTEIERIEAELREKFPGRYRHPSEDRGAK
jgi:hypothetical protein